MQMHDHVLSFFGFSRLPFGKHLQPADTFLSAAHQEALSRLSFGVADEDLLLLTGPIGCGKSVALAAFVSELDGNRYRPLYVRAAGLSEAQLYKAILDETMLVESMMLMSLATACRCAATPRGADPRSSALRGWC